MDRTWRENVSCCAGFFNGEGHTRANWIHGRFWQVRIHLIQAEREVLDDFRSVFGVGKVYGPYPPRKQTHGPRYDYVLVGTAAQAVIAMMWPWLSRAKRRQAAAALMKVKETRDHRSSRFQETCKRGHSLTEEANVFVYYKRGIKYRVCRACARDKARAHRVRKFAHALLVAV